MLHFLHCFKDNLLTETKQVNAEGKRWYEAGGDRFPSVTTVLGILNKDAIKSWRQRLGEEEANKVSSQAARRGTKFHGICEKYLLNEELEFTTPLEKQLFINTKQLLNRINNIHLIEKPLFSKHLRMAGTPDCIAEFDGKLTVIDFKTANKPKRKEWIESYFLQATSYCIMFEERTKIPVPRIAIIIAVEGEPSQLFLEKRDNYAKRLLYVRDTYESMIDNKTLL